MASLSCTILNDVGAQEYVTYAVMVVRQVMHGPCKTHLNARHKWILRSNDQLMNIFTKCIERCFGISFSLI